MRIPILNIFICFLLLSTCLIRCYEPVEGCLDIDATNYEVTADNECDDCCNLPQMTLLFSYLNNENSFILGDTITSLNGNIILNDFYFFLSDIALESDDGQVIIWEDSLRVEDEEGNENYVSNDFRYFDRSTFSATLRGLRFNGVLSSINLNLGLSETINYSPYDSLIINSDLDDARDEAYIDQNNGFFFFSFKLQDDMGGEERTITHFNKYPLLKINLDLNDENVERGDNISINLVLEMTKLLGGIKMNEMTDDEIEEHLITHFISAIELK